MGELRIMGATEGDKTLKWDPSKPKQVKKAEEAFNKHIAEGHKAFKVVIEQVKKQGKEIKKFDPTAAEIILTAPVAGG